MNAETVYNETSNVNVNEKSNWIKQAIIATICSKRLQGAFMMLTVCAVGFYYYDPIMNWVSPPPPVVIPEPWYVFWK